LREIHYTLPSNTDGAKASWKQVSWSGWKVFNIFISISWLECLWR